MNPSVFFKIKDSHFMGQIAVSIWPDFQGDWDQNFDNLILKVIVSIWPDFQGDWDYNTITSSFGKLGFNMTQFSRGLRLKLPKL